MRRRDALRSLGGVLAAVALGGCVDGGPSTPAGSPQRADTGETTADTTAAGRATRTRKERATDRSIVDRSFRVTDAGCGTQTDEARVTHDGIVSVVGTIWGTDGCATAVLDDVEFDSAVDRLVVSVVTRRRDTAEGCAACLTEIDYEASVEVVGGAPTETVVVHDGRTVATAKP